jgi:hypothetical protein
MQKANRVIGLVPIMLDYHREQVCEVSMHFLSVVMEILAYMQKLRRQRQQTGDRISSFFANSRAKNVDLVGSVDQSE